MSDDATRQWRALGDLLETLIDDVRLDEVRSVDLELGDVSGAAVVERTRRSPWLAVAAAVLVAVAGLLVLGSLIDGGDAVPSGRDGSPAGAGLADALAGHTWVAIDYPLAGLPWLHFEHGDGASVLDVAGYDGCNHQDGSLRLDGTQVADSRIMSTLIGCGSPAIPGLWDGTEFSLIDGELTVSNPTDSAGPMRWVAIDSYTPVAPADLVGQYMLGTDVFTVTADTIDVDGCVATWSPSDSGLEVAEPGCPWFPPGRWTPVGDAEVVILAADGRYVRLDRASPDAPGRPALPAFLGALAGRTWVLDTPTDTFALGRRPSFQAPGEPAFVGFDGCNTYSVEGTWSSAGGGWALTAGEIATTDAGCGADRPRVVIADGDVFTLTNAAQVILTKADGTEHRFQNVRGSTPRQTFGGTSVPEPLRHLPGRWQLDPGVEVEFVAPPGGAATGEVRIGGCAVPWWGSGIEWIAAGPVAPECAAAVTGGSAPAFLQLLAIAAVPGEPTMTPITVGTSADARVLYLASADGTLAFRLTSVD